MIFHEHYKGRSMIANNLLTQVPILDGSACAWLEAIEKVGVKEALDQQGNNGEKVAPYLNEPVHVWRNDSFIAAFPSPKVRITCGVHFPKV